MKNIEEFSGKVQKNGPAGRKKKDKTERVTGLGRRTREEMVKWNQMTVLRLDRGETSDIPGLPLGLHTGVGASTGAGCHTGATNTGSHISKAPTCSYSWAAIIYWHSPV